MLLKSRKFLLLDIVPSREKCKISNPHKNEKYAKKHQIYIKNGEERPQEKTEVPIPWMWSVSVTIFIYIVQVSIFPSFLGHGRLF